MALRKPPLAALLLEAEVLFPAPTRGRPSPLPKGAAMPAKVLPLSARTPPHRSGAETGSQTTEYTLVNLWQP
jgi:hypothetical protein